MFDKLRTLSTKFRVLVLTTAVIFGTVVVTQLRNVPVAAYPEFAPPMVQIQTEAPGLSAAEVEQLVTVPLEQDLLNGVAWLQTIRSRSMPGVSAIDLLFEPGTDLLKARQLVNERLTQAAALPSVGTPPTMLPPLSSAGRVLMIGLTAPPGMSPAELSILARWKIKPRLMGVPGVADVAIYGQRDRQIQVQVDPDRLHRRKVTLDQVVSTAGDALWVSPLTFLEASTPGTGGFVENGNQRLAIQHVLPITTPKDLAAVPVEGDATGNIRLGEVADVVEGHQQLIGAAALGDGQGLMLVVEKFPGADTREVTTGVEDALRTLAPGVGGARFDTHVYRPASYLDQALGDLGRWALFGLVLALAALGLVLRSWRAVVIGLVTIPLSLLTAACVLYLTGATFDFMVLGGFAAAVGIVIDEAVPTNRSRSSLIYAALVMLTTLLPVWTLTGVAGSFAKPLVTSYALAVLASFLVALIVTPALASTLHLRQRQEVAAVVVEPEHAPSRRRSLAVGALTAILVLAAAAALPQLRTDRSLLPTPLDRNVLVHWQAAPGTSLDEMTRITDSAVSELRNLPGVQEVNAHVGRALSSDQVVNVDQAELWATLKPSAPHDRTVSAIQKVLAGYPGLHADLTSYPQDQLREAHTSAPGKLVVRVYGQDYDTLAAQAEQIRALLGTVPGVADPKVQSLAVQPTLEVQVDLAAAQRAGVKPGDVRRAAAVFFAGLPVGSIYEQQKIFDVTVWSAPDRREAPNSLAELLIDTPSGGQVRLGDVASIRIAPFPTVISHEATSRSLDVTARVSGRSLNAVDADVRAGIAKLAMPYEYHAEVLGDAAARQSADRRTLVFALAALITAFLILQAAFRSWLPAGLVLLLLPMAVSGGVVGAYFAGPGHLASVGALLGLLAAAGVATRHLIGLTREYQVHGQAHVRDVTREWARPIVATVVATAAVLLPPLFAGSAPGTEILRPLAIVAIGGLATSLICSLFLLPIFYRALIKGSSQQEVSDEQPE